MNNLDVESLSDAIKISTEVDLAALNTLRLKVQAKRVVAVLKPEVLPTLFGFTKGGSEAYLSPDNLTLLGQGSNTVFTHEECQRDLLLVSWRGITQLESSREGVVWRVAAGESWHRLVMTALNAGLSGLENLALIPGSVGAAPVQNIGAYGVELAERLVRVVVFDLLKGEFRTLERSECEFSYRHSLFKTDKGQSLVIVYVDIFLSKQFVPNLSYQPLKERFSASNEIVTPLVVAQAVIALRRSKLPDPRQLPNAGSFFKNPVVSFDKYQSLKAIYPSLIAFPVVEDRRYKLAAGWLIEKAGFKGVRFGLLGMHEKQALVLVNHADPARGEFCTGEMVISFAQKVSTEVKKLFGVQLEIEPAVIQ